MMQNRDERNNLKQQYFSDKKRNDQEAMQKEMALGGEHPDLEADII
jgi:hypothetical protein